MSGHRSMSSSTRLSWDKYSPFINSLDHEQQVAWWEPAQYMLQQLRQRCAKSQQIQTSSFNSTEQGTLTVNFGFKATQFILDFWNHSSAFKTLRATEDAGDNTPWKETLPSTANYDRDFTYCVMSDSDRKSRQELSAPLTFMFWKQSPCTAVQPWEVIPVTRKESTLFHNVPVSQRPQLISVELAAAVETRLYQLRRHYCDIINEPNNYKFAECMQCSPELDYMVMISSKVCRSCSKNTGLGY